MTLTYEFPSIITFFGKRDFFQVIRTMNLFCGGRFSARVSSEKLLAVSAAGPPAAFFPEIDMSGFFGHAHFGKVCITMLTTPAAKFCIETWSSVLNISHHDLKPQENL